MQITPRNATAIVELLADETNSDHSCPLKVLRSEEIAPIHRY